MLASSSQSNAQSVTPSVPPPSTGLLVDRVKVGSTASQAGLLVGDVIISIGGQALDQSSNQPIYQSVIASHKPGEVIVLEVYRPASQRVDPLPVELASTEAEYTIERVREIRSEFTALA
jgi:S1-C subfamily serine protease